MDEITNERRKSIEQSIHTISAAELQTLGEGLFPYVDHPWRATLLTFIAENANANFYHATTHDHIHVVYCHDKNRGMWFIPGSGVGPLQPKGLAILKEVVEAGD